MKQYGEITIDESKATIGDWIELFSNANQNIAFLLFEDKIVDGGIRALPLSDMPKISTALMRFLSDNTETILIALASLKNHLEGDE